MYLQPIMQNALFYDDNLKILHRAVHSLVLSSVAQGSFWDRDNSGGLRKGNLFRLALGRKELKRGLREQGEAL